VNPFQAPPSLGKLTIEITTQCNIKCAGCPRTTGISQGMWTDMHMELELFQRILDHIPHTEFVTLHGIGEPTLHPQFNEIVAMAKQSGKFTRMKMTTNALARSVEYYKDSVKAGLDEFWVSVDSFDQDILDVMRAGSKAEKLERRVGELIAAGLPLHVSMVVSAANYLDIANTLRKLHALGNPLVHMQEFQDFGNTYGLMSLENRTDFLHSMKAVLTELPDLRVVLPNYAQVQGDYCMAPWFRPAISVQGYMTPCCTTFDPSQFGYVNLGEMSFEQAWQQRGILSWIERFLQDQTPICRGCGLNPRSFGVENVLGQSGKTGNEQHILDQRKIS